MLGATRNEWKDNQVWICKSPHSKAQRNEPLLPLQWPRDESYTWSFGVATLEAAIKVQKEVQTGEVAMALAFGGHNRKDK